MYYYIAKVEISCLLQYWYTFDIKKKPDDGLIS